MQRGFLARISILLFCTLLFQCPSISTICHQSGFLFPPFPTDNQTSGGRLARICRSSDGQERKNLLEERGQRYEVIIICEAENPRKGWETLIITLNPVWAKKIICIGRAGTAAVCKAGSGFRSDSSSVAVRCSWRCLCPRLVPSPAHQECSHPNWGPWASWTSCCFLTPLLLPAPFSGFLFLCSFKCFR